MLAATPPDTPHWAALELDALARLGAARTVIDAVLTGEWDAEPGVITATGHLVDTAADRLHRAHTARKAAA